MLYTYTHDVEQYKIQLYRALLAYVPDKEQVEEHHPSHNCLLWWVLLVAAVAASLSCGPQSADITWWVEGGGEVCHRTCYSTLCVHKQRK